MGRTQVFISYAHADTRWRERVKTHLLVLAHEGQIDIWDDRQLEAGDDWLERIDERMSHAGIAVLLISSSFLSSDFILRTEVPALFKRHEADGMRLYPLLIRSCPWQEVQWLAQLQIRPEGARPVSDFSGNKVDKVLSEVAREIAALARLNAQVGRTEPRSKAQVSHSGSTPRDFSRAKPEEQTSKGFSRGAFQLQVGQRPKKPHPLTTSQLAKRLKKDIQGLQVSGEVRKSIYSVLLDPKYPERMSISGKLVKNPVWQGVGAGTRRGLVGNHPLDSFNAPPVMHLDMLLIRCNDSNGRGHLFTYFSKDWKTSLITFRQRLPEDDPNRRLELNASHLAKHLSVPPDTIRIDPLPRKYAISVKPHAKYKDDLIIYVFEFCSVEFSQKPERLELVRNDRASKRWFSLEALRRNTRASSVNGDVIRALHVLFSISLGSLPPSLPDEFVQPARN